MNQQLLFYTLLISGIIGLLSAVVLFFIAKKFNVEEDPRIDEVTSVLPGANCGGCGYPGCRSFGEACVCSASFDKLFCPVGGNETMANVAKILGREAVVKAPTIAVVRCSGGFDKRPQQNHYDGPQSCAVSHMLYGGETGCQYGCMGFGDCAKACRFDALSMNPKTGLPVVSETACVACGACVPACPRHIIEMRQKGPKGHRVFISCTNEDKGAVAIKNCKVACIACGKCVKECPVEAITLQNNLAYINDKKCNLCGKCVPVCPTKAILETGALAA